MVAGEVASRSWPVPAPPPAPHRPPSPRHPRRASGGAAGLLALLRCAYAPCRTWEHAATGRALPAGNASRPKRVGTEA